MRRRKGHWKWSRKMCAFESLWCYIIDVWFCVSYSTPLVFCVFLVEMKVIIDLTEHQIRLYDRTIFLKWGSVKICPMCYEPWTSNWQPHVCRVLCAKAVEGRTQEEKEEQHCGLSQTPNTWTDIKNSKKERLWWDAGVAFTQNLLCKDHHFTGRHWFFLAVELSYCGANVLKPRNL